MAGPNYDKMAMKDLLDHQNRIQKAISGAKERAVSDARNDVAQLLARRGLSMDDMVETGRRTARASKGSKVAPKYRNPENPSETWTGRGRQPRWLVAKLAKGGKIDSYRI